MYWLGVGKTPDGTEYFGANVGTSTSVTVRGLPLDGSPVFVRLWSKIINTWDGHFADARFTAKQGVRPALVRPVPGAQLTSSTLSLEWSQGEEVETYWLGVGRKPDGTEFFGRSVGLNLSQTIDGIRLDGAPVFVRLWWKINGSWNFVDFQFKTSR